jgi:hypothetical protein
MEAPKVAASVSWATEVSRKVENANRRKANDMVRNEEDEIVDATDQAGYQS